MHRDLRNPCDCVRAVEPSKRSAPGVTSCDILAKHVVIVRKAYQGGASAKGVRKVRCKASGDREATLRKPLSPDHR